MLSSPSLLGRLIYATLALVLATAIWLPLVQFFFRPTLPPPREEGPVRQLAEGLLAGQIDLWTPNATANRDQQFAQMRRTNAEWDFMARNYFAWSLAELCLHEPEHKAEYLPLIDRVIEDTLAAESTQGMHYFLMPYSRHGNFVQQPARSLFVDGEIALVLAMRCLVEDDPHYHKLLDERVSLIVASMSASPVLCGESYPNECWMFCNTMALAAVRIADYLETPDPAAGAHAEFLAAWLASAKQNLVDPETGLLISSFTYDGQTVIDGPEGSSIFQVAHNLQLIDEEFARDQYNRARHELGRDWLGMGFAREWPANSHVRTDVDSGPIVPLVGASAGASGLALLGARSFDDREYYRALETSLNFAAFPHRENGRLQYLAGNEVGDAVLLYSAVLGPAWQQVRAGAATATSAETSP